MVYLQFNQFREGETKMLLGSSKSEVYLHIVWATRGRQPLLTEATETDIHRCIQSEAKKLRCDVLAIGGMPDHVHLVVKFPTSRSIAYLLKQVKGVSSALANDLSDHKVSFRWQTGYSAFSISRSHVARVVRYVKTQRQHHASSQLWPEWEES